MKRVCRKVVALALVLAMAFAYLPQGVVNVKAAANDVTVSEVTVSGTKTSGYSIGAKVTNNDSVAHNYVVIFSPATSSTTYTDKYSCETGYISAGASVSISKTGLTMYQITESNDIGWDKEIESITARVVLVEDVVSTAPFSIGVNECAGIIKGISKYNIKSGYKNSSGSFVELSTKEYIGFEYVDDSKVSLYNGTTIRVRAIDPWNDSLYEDSIITIDSTNPSISLTEKVVNWIKYNQLNKPLEIYGPAPVSNTSEVKMTNASVSGTKLTYTATNTTNKYITSFTYKSSAGNKTDSGRCLAPNATEEIAFDFGESVIGIELSSVTTIDVSVPDVLKVKDLKPTSSGVDLSVNVGLVGDYKCTVTKTSGETTDIELKYNYLKDEVISIPVKSTDITSISIEVLSGFAVLSNVKWISVESAAFNAGAYVIKLKNNSTVANVESLTLNVKEDGVASTRTIERTIPAGGVSDGIFVSVKGKVVIISLDNITATTNTLSSPSGSGSLSASDVYTKYDGSSWTAYYTIKNNDTTKTFDSYSATLTIAGNAISDTQETYNHSKSLKAGKSSKFSQTVGNGTDYIYVKAFGIGDATEGESMPTYDSKLDDTGVHERDENGKKYAQWSCVELGSYKGSPIVWRIVKNSGGTATLVADQAIVDCPFATTKYAVNWEDSAVRAYLNGDFITEAGLDSVGLMEVTLDTPVNSTASSTKPTACTTADKVSIPSIEELCMFGMWGTKDALVGTIGTRQMECGDSLASSKTIALDKTETYCDYMLRNSGYYSWNVSYVTSQGKVNVGGCPTYSNALGVVPVIRVSSSSLTKTAPGRVVKLQSDPAKTSADDIVKTGKRSSTLSKLGLAAYGTKKTIKKVTYTVTSDIEEDSELPADVVGGAIANGRTVAITGVKKGAKSITIPSTVTIAGETFKVTSIDGKAFKKAKKTLKSIKINADTLEYVDSDAFKGLGKSTTIKTNASNYSKVKKAVKSSKAKAKVKK